VTVMWKSDIEASLVMIRKLLSWLMLLFISVRLYLPEPCMRLVLSSESLQAFKLLEISSSAPLDHKVAWCSSMMSACCHV